ncbi:protein Lines homolog 1-like [Syngnathus acus]|uniref:protein Lines homolog 1-like n=1 Tax=Syngnathus acus TaxID=161584 RepID=UPI001885EC4A|nr:protein Lines homolog 1-like [Syngnathus acus]
MASPGAAPRRLVAVLAEAYECLVNARATKPKQDAEQVARAIIDGVHAHSRYGAAAQDATCLALTLIGRIVATVTAPTSHLARFYQDTLEVLLRDLDVVSQMVATFACEERDQVVRHLAAKSASACVLYQLQVSGVLHPSWHGTCERALLSLPAGPQLDACLWSLTHVLQELLRTKRPEPVRTLIAAFDVSVCTAASRFLSADQSAGGASGLADTFCHLLDLLEFLTASGGGSPRLTYVHAAALVAAVSRAPLYFVSKRAALLLKRAALRKAGEDWLGMCGESAADLGALTAAVLDAATADWLSSVSAESLTFFGGSRSTKGGSEDGECDTAMLRAVSLLLIKSVQYHVTSAATGDGEAGGHLTRLWRFLRERGVRPTDGDHDCALLPLLFGEQDDDMMEAAKAALVIFLRLRENCASAEAPCAAGCNPHCHFLFLLRAVWWDHRILLDFLMSTETCFLEYFLRYLRYLRTEWRGFAASCRRLDAEALPRVPFGRDGEGRRRRRTGQHTLGRARRCLLRLHLLLARLHHKKLFPYKADALLRLLWQVTRQLGQDGLT